MIITINTNDETVAIDMAEQEDINLNDITTAFETALNILFAEQIENTVNGLALSLTPTTTTPH